MPAGATYEPITTYTLGSSTNEVNFTSIPQTYTDLILVYQCGSSGAGNTQIRFNGDSTAIYSTITMYGLGSGSAGSGGYPNINVVYPFVAASLPSSNTTSAVLQFNNYSNTTTYKTMLSRHGNAATEVDFTLSTWRSTAAINAIRIYTYSGNNYVSGSTFTLYGIKAA